MEDGEGSIGAGAHDNRRDVESHVTRAGDNAKVRVREDGTLRRKKLHLTEMADLGRIRGKRSANGLAHVTEDKVGSTASAIDGGGNSGLESGSGHGAVRIEVIGIDGAVNNDGPAL